MQERLTDAEKLAHLLALIQDEVALGVHQSRNGLDSTQREAAVYSKIKRFLTYEVSRGYCAPGRYTEAPAAIPSAEQERRQA